MQDHEDMMESSSNKVEYIKFFTLIGLLVVASLGLNSWFGSADATSVLRWFMGLFFVTFGTFKFIGYEMFTQMFPDYDILAAKSKFYTYFYPFLELILGLFYLLNVLPVPRDVVTLFIMSVGAYGVFKSIRAHGDIQCACLGDIIKLPLSTVSLAEDVIMAIMAAYMLFSNLS